MKIITLKIFAIVVGLSLVGCADLERKFAASDGLIDFILAGSGYEQMTRIRRSAFRGERAKSSPRTHERIRAASLYSGMLASSTAPIGSPRRGHMLMSLCWIPKADFSRALQLDSFLRRCQRPNGELGAALAILCGYRFCRLPVQRLLSRFTKSRLFNANIRTIVKRIAR